MATKKSDGTAREAVTGVVQGGPGRPRKRLAPGMFVRLSTEERQEIHRLAELDLREDSHMARVLIREALGTRKAKQAQRGIA